MKIHQLQGYIQNIYLVEQDNQLMLLDGCCRCDVNLLKQFITQQLNRPITDLKIVIVTHMHPDHAGAAHKLRKISNCKIVAADKPHPWYKGFVGYIMFLTDIILTHWVARRIGKSFKSVWFPRVLKPDLKLKTNDEVPGFNGWKIIETPGHTDRDLSIWHEASGKIYVADLVIKIRKLFISPFPIFHPNKYRASLQIIDQLQPQYLLLAHGGQVDVKGQNTSELIRKIPDKPKTHWRATRIKIKRLLDRF
jgi:glyoxylase-like metal-dependent hydrolase (beta-lactamase superfamily II)